MSTTKRAFLLRVKREAFSEPAEYTVIVEYDSPVTLRPFNYTIQLANLALARLGLVVKAEDIFLENGYQMDAATLEKIKSVVPYIAEIQQEKYWPDLQTDVAVDVLINLARYGAKIESEEHNTPMTVFSYIPIRNLSKFYINPLHAPVER